MADSGKPDNDKADQSLFSMLADSVKGVTGTFSGLVSVIQPFVAALNPATIELFDQAMQDLAATVGVALQPLMDAATQLARELGSVLLPVMEQLRPIIAEVAGVLLDTLVPVVQQFAGILESLMPVIQFLAGVLKAVATGLQAVVAVISAVVQSFASAVGGLFGENGDSWVDKLTSAMEFLAKQFVALAGVVMRFFGMDTALNRLIGNLEDASGVVEKKWMKMGPDGKFVPDESMNKKKPSNVGLAAPRDVMFTGLADFGKQVAQAAFTATAGGLQEKTGNEWMAEIAADLREMKGNKTDWKTMIKDAVVLALNEAGKFTLNAPVYAAQEGINVLAKLVGLG